MTSRTGTAGEVGDNLGFGIIVTDLSGVVIEANETAREIVAASHGNWPENATCSSLFGCNHSQPLATNCLASLAADSETPLPEVRVDIPPGRATRAVWITAARASPGSSRLVMHLRPATLGDRRRRTELHWMGEPQLRIRALGTTLVETGETKIEGDWLLHRPGHLLKYLICQRGRPAHVYELVEALWPSAGSSGENTARYFVHVLRELLEPHRVPRSNSGFIHSANGTYCLDRNVYVDLDEFEALVSAGLEISAETPAARSQAISCLDRAMDLYRGDLFAEEPFAEWAFEERETMRNLACHALDALVEHHLASRELAAATRNLERYASLQPLDSDVHQILIRTYLEQGHRSEAQRRYAAFRRRLIYEFGEEPEFRLSDIAVRPIPSKNRVGP